MRPTTTVAAGLALALAGAAGPAESQEVTIRSDSAGIQIVTSDPSRSDATCSLGDEPIFRIGNDESDEAQWFSTIALARTSETEVRLLDDELRPRRILRWPDSDRDVTGADVRAWRDDYIESRGGRNSPNWSMIDDLVVSDDVPAADVFPAFSYVEIGRDGRVWVLPYWRPRAEATRLMGFDRDGGFLCHLEYSHSGLTAYEFGADYWLGVQADELGVETVVVYRLTTPGDG